LNHVTSDGSDELELKKKETGVVSFEENSSFEKHRKKMELKSVSQTPEETKRS
jgi:hypothetical protein